MRWYIVRILLHKEFLRHLADRGSLGLALLLVVAALLLSLFGKSGDGPAGLVGGAQTCFVDYWHYDPWVEHLRGWVPPELKDRLVFRPCADFPTHQNQIVYPPGSGAIQIRNADQPCQVLFWHPGKDTAALAPFETWFWRESYRFQRHSPLLRLAPGPVPAFTAERCELKGGLDARSGIATALVLFALFFACVYLLPSLTCEERERGVLLAQALSPATPLEILAAKFLFYPALGIGLGAILAGIYNPAVLLRPFFWLALLTAALGSMGIGLTIACLARTQRAASMAALCYMLAVALILFICQQNHIPLLPYLALEYHGPRMLHAVLADNLQWYHWGHLGGAAALAVGWALTAQAVFRRCGWQ